MKFRFHTPKQVPPGTYVAELGSAREVTGIWGPQLRLAFKICDGDFQDEVVPTWCSLTYDDGTQIIPSPNNKLGRTLADLNDDAIELDQEVDVDQFIGQRYEIVLEDHGENRIRIATITRVLD